MEDQKKINMESKKLGSQILSQFRREGVVPRNLAPELSNNTARRLF